VKKTKLFSVIDLAESDLIYTESIMCRGAEDYANKEILILGGGDGALLYELRKENPKHVTMIEIDELVMQVCKVHLRSTCGDTLDTYKGSNYEVLNYNETISLPEISNQVMIIIFYYR